MDDRWLFLAAFCLLLLVCGMIIRWLVKQLRTTMTDHQRSRDTHTAELQAIIRAQNETALRLAGRRRRNNGRLPGRARDKHTTRSSNVKC